MQTHRIFHFGVIKALQAHSEIAPTYSYYFSFRKGLYSMGNLYGKKSSEWGKEFYLIYLQTFKTI
jgi:hypothetical protein